MDKIVEPFYILLAILKRFKNHNPAATDDFWGSKKWRTKPTGRASRVNASRVAERLWLLAPRRLVLPS